KALLATSIAGGFLVFLFEKNWLEAINKKTRHPHTSIMRQKKRTFIKPFFCSTVYLNQTHYLDFLIRPR
ncbi:hypothetical protein SUW42_08600, partial [Streptococcus agalactiae]